MFSLKYGKTNLLIINIFNNLNSQICVLNLFVEMYAANKTLRIFKKKKITKEECYCGCFIQTFIVLFFSYMVRLICCDQLYLESSNFQKNFCKSSVTYDAPSKVILHKLLGCTAYHGSFICISILRPKEIVRKELLIVNLTICKSYMIR